MQIERDKPLIGNPIDERYKTEDAKCLSTTGANRQTVELSRYFEGFTLAEVLITLSIIGVVLALTIPSFTAKDQEKETVTKVKKAYSEFSQAYILAKTQYGPFETWQNTEAKPYYILENILKPMNTIRICKEGRQACFPDTNYKNFDGSYWYNFYTDIPSRGVKAILANGTLVHLYLWDAGCKTKRGNTPDLQSICANIHMDTNGAKGPSQAGKDVFSFYITKNSIIPVGLPDETLNPLSKCKSSGYSCTAWVLLKENMDYLKKDVNWGN